MIFVVDFGGQTAHLIGRRIRGFAVKTKTVLPEDAYVKAKKEVPQGIILSGGPASVYEKGAPSIDKKIFNLCIPILGICYGLQLIAHLLGGKVIAGRKEYGPAIIKLKINSAKQKQKLKIRERLPQRFTVWMSHGDEVVKLSRGFRTLGSTEHVPFAFVEDAKRKIIGLQFHPEVEHTEFGLQILENFLSICHPEFISGSRNKFGTPSGIPELVRHDRTIEGIKQSIRRTVEDSYVIGAVSGGVDSSVAAYLTAKAIGKRFIPVYVDNGLMRVGTKDHVVKIFKKIGIRPIVVNRAGKMLKRLKGVIDAEEKRKIIGNFYIEIFEEQVERLRRSFDNASDKNIKFLLQGTIYSDVIESQGTKHAAKIKSHHNVGGLPQHMKLKLLEPLRFFYKDEVKEIGRRLGLSKEFVEKQPFPGPGYAVRIRGEVTKERLAMEKMADEIVLEELKMAKLLDRVFLSFPVMTGAFSTSVKGDSRHFGEVVAIRIIESQDVMTAKWPHLPYNVLQRISSRIVNEVPNVSRVVYDITTKPPATMEWE